MPAAKIISSSSSSIQLDKTPYAALSKSVPSIVNKTLTFELSGTNCAMANAIRRTLMSEIPVRHLTVSLTDIKTTDPYVIGETIRKRIEMIPISQSTNRDAVFAVRFENNTDEYIDILSSEIKLNGMVQTKDVLPFIPICDINSGTSFSINDIHVVESYGYDNSRVSIGRVAYEILDQDFSRPSLTSTPSTFRLEIETPGIYNPTELVLKALDGLTERLDAIDYSKSIVEFGIYKLSIMNETYTIGKLLSWYIYQAEPTIKYVASRVPHPSQRECIVDIHHPSGKELCMKAVESIKVDLKALRKAFK